MLRADDERGGGGVGAEGGLVHGLGLGGPSTGIPGDFATAQQIGIPGLVWDYEPNEPSTGHLTTSHAINAPSRLYPIIPPERRNTP